MLYQEKLKRSKVSDHDAVGIVIKDDNIEFHSLPKNPIWPGNKEKFNGFLGILVIFIYLAL